MLRKEDGMLGNLVEVLASALMVFGPLWPLLLWIVFCIGVLVATLLEFWPPDKEDELVIRVLEKPARNSYDHDRS